MSQRLSVRPPQVSDSRALAEAEIVCFSDPWPTRYFASELMAPGRFQRVMTDPQGRLVAYLFTAWQYLDLHVLKVATLPSYRRQGLARRLMALAEEHAAEMNGESLTLEVRDANIEAIAMYDSLGYERAGIRPAYYQDGEDAVIMTKRILNSQF
jgi:ribosomal-protein-alanine acetyltransferase